MINWVGCKNFGVVGYTSSDKYFAYTTTGYTRPIRLPVYTTAGCASSDMNLVYAGYANNDIDVGCSTIGQIEFTALGTG